MGERENEIEPIAVDDAEDAEIARRIRSRIDEGKERTYSHEEIWSEIEELEKRGELPA